MEPATTTRAGENGRVPLENLRAHYDWTTPYHGNRQAAPGLECGYSGAQTDRYAGAGMKKALVGLVVALALAVSASGATFFGIDAWKIVLAAAGAVVFVMGAERRPRGGG